MKERIIQWADRFIRLPVVGLDISDRSVKYAKLASGRRAAFEFFGEAEVPEGVITEGVVERESELAEVLRGILARVGGGFRTIGAVASLPEEKSFVRLLQISKVKPEEIEGAVRWQIEGQIPLPPEDAVYDYELISPSGGGVDHFDAVITAFPRRIVESYVRALKSAGFQPAALELESQAIARAVLRDAAAPEPRVVVDMGRNRTSFSICAAGSVVFTATVPVGGRILEAGIAEALKTDPEEAIRMKKEVGLAKDAYEGKVFLALLPSLETLANELGRAIAYYEDHMPHIHSGKRGIAGVLLSGGDANLRGLDTYLAAKIRVPVEIADPFSSIMPRLAYAVPPLPKSKALAYSAALGLSLRGIA